jgi:hypothetical protein
MAGREKKVATNTAERTVESGGIFITREDMIVDILLQITDACYAESGNDTRWKPIHDQIMALMK